MLPCPHVFSFASHAGPPWTTRPHVHLQMQIDAVQMLMQMPRESLPLPHYSLLAATSLLPHYSQLPTNPSLPCPAPSLPPLPFPLSHSFIHCWAVPKKALQNGAATLAHTSVKIVVTSLPLHLQSPGLLIGREQCPQAERAQAKAVYGIVFALLFLAGPLGSITS